MLYPMIIRKCNLQSVSPFTPLPPCKGYTARLSFVFAAEQKGHVTGIIFFRGLTSIGSQSQVPCSLAICLYLRVDREGSQLVRRKDRRLCGFTKLCLWYRRLGNYITKILIHITRESHRVVKMLISSRLGELNAVQAWYIAHHTH